jgi:hypothetical protein
VNAVTDDFLALAQGISRAGAVTDPRGIASFYGASALGGLLFSSALAGGSTLTTLGTIDVGGSTISTGSTVVYTSSNAAGSVQYAGITGNLAMRAVQHAARFAIVAIPGLSKLSRADARAVEQTLIEFYGLAKNGGQLLNKINSIAATNPIYSSALQRGAELLHRVGYPGF